MNHEALREAVIQLFDKQSTPEGRQRWIDAKRRAAGDDPEAYLASWNDLQQRIERELPLDPKSAKAQGFLAEWDALLVPFANELDDEMKACAGIAASLEDMATEPTVSHALRGAQRSASSRHSGRSESIRSVPNPGHDVRYRDADRR